MNSHKIVILDAYTANPGDLSWDELGCYGQLTVYERTDRQSVVERCREADVVLTNKVVLDSKIIAQLPRLRYIGVLATGYNVVDLKCATQRQITVTNIPAYSTDRPVCPVQPRRQVGELAGFLIHSCAARRIGWQNHRHRRPRKYWQSCGCNSSAVRNEGSCAYE